MAEQGVVSIDDLRAWADAVAAMPVAAPWPARVVLVPDEPQAHALRVELIARAPSALIGTRFMTAAAAARLVLDTAGVAYRTGEEERRRLRIRKLLRDGLTLASYPPAQVRSRGWEDAFAESLEQLEAAGIRPEALEQIGDARAADLARLWRAVDDDAGESWTVHRILAEAAARLAGSPEAWPIDAPVLALVPPFVDASHARFVRALPRVTLGVSPRRDVHARGVGRMRALYGDGAAERWARTIEPSETATELRLLAAMLFADPSQLAAPDRKRSAGPDGTVALEVYAGVDEELDAAARWVTEEVHRGTRLQDIAILVPRGEPMTTLAAARIAELTWPNQVRPVYLPDGRPAASTAAGARLLAVVRAIGAYLPADRLVELLPRLRRHGAHEHLTPGRARLAIERLGTLGGSAGRPEGAREWRDRAARLDADARLAGLGPALAALVDVVELVIADASVIEIWDALRGFAEAHLIVPGRLVDIVEPIDGELRVLAADPITHSVRGVEAVELVEDRSCALRIHDGRFGEASIYVGPIDRAAGLSFAAVRVLGLAESVFPGILREDAVLPAGVRRRLPEYAITTDEDYAIGRSHALAQVVRDTRGRLVLSMARRDLDGSEREPAALFVEVAAALGRPHAITGERAPVVPTRVELERDAFTPARRRARAARLTSPLRAADWLDAVAAGAQALPSAWCAAPVVDPREVDARARTMHGALGPSPLTKAVPGVDPERPLSASALRDLLTCPQRFLLRHVLGLWARPDPVETHRISPLAYGSLVHRIVERFLRAHGAAFGARRHDLSHWIAIARDLANAELDAFLDEYPLLGATAIARERRRLQRDICSVIDADWDGGRPRTFVAVEQPFEQELATGSGNLHVAGRIDRVDIEANRTLVRDLKTGRAWPREGKLAAPSLIVDVQLAMYAAVASSLAWRWGAPTDVVAAYTYVDHLAAGRERAFRDDRDVLHDAATAWLEVAASALRAHVFVRTPDPGDCRTCAYAPVCRTSDAGEVPGVDRDIVDALEAIRR